MRIRIAFLLLCITACSTQKVTYNKMPLPALLKGTFTDDYGIRYTISDSVFSMGGKARYHLLRWNEKEQYLLARNNTANPSDKGLYTRIDYTLFTGMEPFLWGYCFTVYDAADAKAALQAAPADRANPRKGCNGYPFSRMKRVE